MKYNARMRPSLLTVLRVFGYIVVPFTIAVGAFTNTPLITGTAFIAELLILALLEGGKGV